MMKNMEFMVAAYGVIWGVLMAYVIGMHLTVLKLARRLDRLEKNAHNQKTKM